LIYTARCPSGHQLHNPNLQRRTFVRRIPPELDVSSCDGSKEKAAKNLKQAVRLFLEEAAKMGTLDQIVDDARSLRA